MIGRPWIKPVILSILIGVPLVAFASSGIWRIRRDEEGVVTRFGRVARVLVPGIHLTWPYPIERVSRISTAEIRKMSIGFRYGNVDRTKTRDESQWLTGDTNFVDIQMVIQYRIVDSVRYLFRYESTDADFLIRKCAESILTETVGALPVDELFASSGKIRVRQESMRRTQDLMNRFETGIELASVSIQHIKPPDRVSDAFKDVLDAERDRETFRDEAEGYRREILPTAQATANGLRTDARVHETRVLEEARGKAARFLLLHEEYRKDPDSVRQRLLLESLDRFLGRPKLSVFPKPRDADRRREVKILR